MFKSPLILPQLIPYTHFKLPNGLQVIHHQDESTQLCVLNILYNVGSKHEDPNQTGFAHLFEHLMFGGSVNIPEYDTPLQMAGGENNAFTNHDITNYYLTLPSTNIETGFWLESDRMLGLAFNQESLDNQKSVVIEEFKERYFNPPYGDVWLKLLPLSFKEHPYNWPTIGKEISHIENATMDDVKSFFSNFYHPGNAILVIAGNISLNRAKELTDKWFAPIPAGKTIRRHYNPEPKQTEARVLTHHADVPAHLLVKSYHTVARNHPDYYATDLLSDILGSGRSARLHQQLVKERGIFSEIDCYLTGDVEPGLLVIEGKLSAGIQIEEAELAINELLSQLLHTGIPEAELNKVKNKGETTLRFNDIGVLNKAMKLAYACLLENMELVNKEADYYQQVSGDDILRVSNTIFAPHNCSTLYYLASKHANA